MAPGGTNEVHWLRFGLIIACLCLFTERAHALAYFNGYAVNGVWYGFDNPSGQHDFSIALDAGFITVGTESGDDVQIEFEEIFNDTLTSISRDITLTFIPPASSSLGETLIYFTGQLNTDYADASFELMPDGGLELIRWDVDVNGPNDVYFAGFMVDLSDPNDLVRSFSYTVEDGFIPPDAPFLGLQAATQFVPEPSSGLLLAMGFLGFSALRRLRCC